MRFAQLVKRKWKTIIIVLSLFAFLSQIFSLVKIEHDRATVQRIIANNNFQTLFNLTRLNRLFKLLQQKEDNRTVEIFKKLNLPIFSDLAKSWDGQSFSNENQNEEFFDDIQQHFSLTDDYFTANENFFSQLLMLSNYYTFDYPRTYVQPAPIDDNYDKTNFAIVTAVNTDYYHNLQEVIVQLHKHLPQAKIIVYDLGLEAIELEKTNQYCKCEVRNFNYTNVSAHFGKLDTYAWKPIIIQEVLKDYDLVFYMDSSIIIEDSQLNPIVETVQKTSFLAQFMGLDLNCYTSRKMYEWFDETPETFNQSFTLEANFLIFKRSLLSSLIMKAWITCALDENCIAPAGSSTRPCCGCHRYDQAALAIISTYFYGHPKNKTDYLPAYSLTTNESYFFTIERGTPINNHWP